MLVVLSWFNILRLQFFTRRSFLASLAVQFSATLQFSCLAGFFFEQFTQEHYGFYSHRAAANAVIAETVIFHALGIVEISTIENGRAV